jgi:hypothetical protein
MPLEEREQLWQDNKGIDHPDVSLPHDWHLNHANVLVPPVPEEGPKLTAEIRRSIQNLPELLRCKRMYQNPQFWYDFLAWEHTACRRSTFHGEYRPWEAYEVQDSSSPSPDEPYDHYDIVKQEANEAMEDAAPPGVGDLPPEYQGVLAVGYGEDTFLQQVLEASKANEDRAFPDL